MGARDEERRGADGRGGRGARRDRGPARKPREGPPRRDGREDARPGSRHRDEAPSPSPGPLRDAERERCERVLRETIALEGYEPLDLHVRPDRTIAITLDCERKPVTLGSCTFMNRRLRAALEGAGLPTDHYAIEVSSPGTKRPLRTRRHFERFEGEPIRVVVPGPDGGREVLRGQLVGVTEEGIRFEPRRGERRTIPLADIREARLDPYQDEECD